MRLTPVVLIVIFLAACSRPEPPPAPAAGTPETDAAPTVGQTESAEPQKQVELQIRDWESTQQLAREKQGRVVVLDLWATYCPPCVAEFPNLVALQAKYPEQVACISVSADFEGLEGKPPESYAEKVLAFLQKQNATFDNILLSTDADTLFTQKIEHNSLPAVYVYDQQGNLAGQFPDPKDPAEFTYQEQVLPLVEKLLTNQ